jgi:hypothetical protein
MAVIDGGSSTAGKANVDANYNLQVNLPTTVSQSGYAQKAYSPNSAVSRINRINEDGQAYYAEGRQVFHADFNAVTVVQSARWGTNATTMTKAVQTNGFMRLNNGAITTTSTGVAIYSNRVITIENGYDYRVRFQLRHANAVATNKQVDAGLGYYLFAAGQANAMNEFIGFRWTTAGGLLGVLETSEGGAAGAQTVSINSNVPYSDNVAREYEILITELEVQFWVDGVYQARIAKQSTMYGVIKGCSLPFIFRQFHSGAASAAATFDIAQISVIKIGADDGQSHPARMAAMDKSSYYQQPDIQTTATLTHNLPASGSVPTAATGSNTASVLNSTAQMGGFFRMNGATITATVHSTFWVAGYLNPAVPTAIGVGVNSRNFYVTGITVTPLVVSTVLVGGGFAAIWFAAIGATALTSATTDADGTTAVAQKTDRLVPLARVTSFGAAAAVGTLETGAGDSTVQFATPLVIHPGEHLKIGLRTTFVTAAVTSGTIDGAINVNGYWD